MLNYYVDKNLRCRFIIKWKNLLNNMTLFDADVLTLSCVEHHTVQCAAQLNFQNESTCCGKECFSYDYDGRVSEHTKKPK